MKRAPAALLVATMDTKGREARFISECLNSRGIGVHILDAGIRGESPFPVQVSRQEVASAGGMSIEAVRAVGHEGEALEVMCRGAVYHARRLVDRGMCRGIIGLGGSMGTTLGTAVMRSFPVGVPKVMISTMASRDTRPFVGTRDILMLHSVCDLAGLNRLTCRILQNGALALAGMLDHEFQTAGDTHRPLVFLSTLGTTEACAQRVRAELEKSGIEVVVFHTVGSGGKAMDEMIEAEKVDAVIDMSLHELADHLFGGDYDAGPQRSTAALRKKIPTLLIPGNVDFIVSGPLENARRRFSGRPCHVHNAAITVVRTSAAEMRLLADRLAEICRSASGPVEVLLPAGGFSSFGCKSGPLHDPESDAAFCDRLLARMPESVRVDRVPQDINDPAFADLVCHRFAQLAGHAIDAGVR